METLNTNSPLNTHKNGGGGGNNLPKKLALSISLIAAAALELAANSNSIVTIVNGHTNRYNVPRAGADDFFYNHTKTAQVIYTYYGGTPPPPLDLWTQDNSKNFQSFSFELKSNSDQRWFHMHYRAYERGNNSNIGISNVRLIGDNLKFEFDFKGSSSISNFINEGKQVNLRATQSDSTLNVGTIEQNSSVTPPNGNANTQIFQNVFVTTLDVNAGSAANNGGTITNANINGGEFRHTSGNTETATLNSGSLTQANGSITTLTQNAGLPRKRAAR